MFTGSTLDPDIYIRFIGLSVYLLLFAIFSVLYLQKTKAVSDKIFFVYLVYVAYSLISVFSARNISDGIFDWIKILYGLILLFVYTVILNNSKTEDETAKAFTLLSLVLSTAGLIQLLIIILQKKLIIPLSTYEIAPFYGHRNLYCQMLFFSFPFTLLQAVYGRKSTWRITGIISFAISLFLLIILSNRATWLALSGAGAALIFFHIIYFKKFRKDFIKVFPVKKILILLPVLIIIFSYIFYAKYADVSSLGKHAEGIVNFEQGSAKDRLGLWTRTIEMIKEKPLFGHGLSDWKIEMLRYGNKGLVSENNNTFYQRPHNDFLWIMSETGFIGILLFCAVFIIAAFYLFRIISKCSSYNEFLFFNTIGAVFIGFLVFSFFSFPKERTETTIVTSVILGLIIKKYREIKGERYFTPAAVRTIIICIIALVSVSLYIGCSRYVSDTHAKKALIAKDKKNYAAVIREINKAVSPFYRTDPFSTPLAWYRGSAYYNMNNTEMALKDFEEAYAINPYHIHVLNNLASAKEMKDEHDDAIRFYKKALATAPDFEDAWLNLCAVYYNLGQTDSAYRALTKIDVNTKNTEYKKFIRVVLKAEFAAVLKNNPFMKKWFDIFNMEPEKYFIIHEYSVKNKVEINSIFADSLLMGKIFL